MPVSFSHIGPEKFFGSSDCRPASQTMLMVVPLYCCAALTAVSAALCPVGAGVCDAVVGCGASGLRICQTTMTTTTTTIAAISAHSLLRLMLSSLCVAAP